MEVANLQNQIAIDNANNKFLANLYENVITMRTRRGPPGIEGPMVIPSTPDPKTRNSKPERAPGHPGSYGNPLNT